MLPNGLSVSDSNWNWGILSVGTDPVEPEPLLLAVFSPYLKLENIKAVEAIDAGLIV